MTKNFIKSKILSNFNYNPTNDQEIIINKLHDFLINDSDNNIFVLNGYAGTGKTSLIGAFVKALNEIKIKFRLLAPTGRAAKVLSEISGFQAYTIHKQIYRQKSGNDIKAEFNLGYNKQDNTIFIIDEASMISNEYSPNSIFGSGRLLTDLINYVFSKNNCKLMFIGDKAQLPPVNTLLSPALDTIELKNQGFDIITHEMTQVIRQAKKSGILMNATKLRDILRNSPDDIPKFETEVFSDIERITGNEIVEYLESDYDKYGIDEVKVICRSNKYANKYNNGIRNQILWREEELSPGDLLMVVKNNYKWLPENAPFDFIANGDMIEIVRLKKAYEMYDLRFQDAVIKFTDYPDTEIECRLMLDCLDTDGPALPYDQSKKLFESVNYDYSHLAAKEKKQAIRKDPFLNALQVKYAYAFTCHKSQGGQWKNIYIDQGYISEDMLGMSYLRWIYTALTRAVEKVYLVNFPDSFF